MKCSKRCLIRLFSFGIFAIVLLLARNFKLMSDAQQSRLALENTYKSAIEQLADACQSVSETLEKQLCAASPDMQKQLSTKLYEQASAAKTALAQLPLERQELENTYKFLSQVGSYSLSVSKKLDNKTPVSDKDYDNISKLFDYSQKLADDMWELESAVRAGEIDLSQTGLPSEKTAAPTVIDGFADFEESFDDYPHLIYDGPFSDNIMEKTPKMTANEKPVTQKQALERCCIALNANPSDFEKITEVGGKMHGWRFTNADSTVSCEVTKGGGHVSYFLKWREIGEEKLTREEAEKTARKYLEYLGMLSMKTTYHEVQGGVMTVNFAYNDLGKCVYTDLVKVSVAMDSGEILGFDQRGYLVNHCKRTYPKTLFSKLRAQEKVSPKLKIESSQLAVIPTDNLDEKLCYEFRCKAKNGRNVLVYINAETGEEQQILLLVESQSGTLTV